MLKNKPTNSQELDNKLREIIYESMGFAPKSAIPNLQDEMAHNFWISQAVDSLKTFFCETVEFEQESDINKHIEERLKMHRDNLRLWQNGTLTPTEPDEEERTAVMRGLMGAINELEVLREFLEK